MKTFILTVFASAGGFLVAMGILFLLSLCSCTYNISMAHTEGTASDVIDDTPSAQATLTPVLTYPGAK